MAGDNAISVRIGADSSGFRSGAKEAEDHVSELSAKLREFKSEHVQTARATRFFSNEIEHLGLVSGETSGALGSLIAGFAVGGGLGVAVGTVKLLAEAMGEATKGVREQAEAFKKLEEDAAEYSKKTRQHVIDVIAALHGETEAQRQDRKETVPFLVQKIGLVDRLRDAQKRLRDIEANTDENGGVADIVGLVRAQTEVDELKARIVALQEKLDSSNEGSGDLAKDAATTAARKKAADAQNASIALRTQMLEAEHTVTTDLWSKDVERQQVAFDTAQTLKKQQDDYALMVRDAENFLTSERAAQFAADEAAKAEAQQAQEAAEAAAEAKKLAHEMGHAVLQMGEAAGQAFLGMIEGTKSVQDALIQLVAQMVEAALRMAALREIASGDFIGGGLLVAGSVIAGGLGSLTGGGNKSSNITINQHFPQGSVSPGAASLEFQRGLVSTIRDLQRRGRL